MSEILGVLFKYLLAMLAIVAVVAVLYEALGSSNTSTAVSDVSQIQADVYQLYSATPNSASAIPVGVSAAIAAGVIPSAMQSSSSSSATIIDPWGGAVTSQAPTGLSSTATAVLALTFPAVPLSVCAKLAVGAAKSGVAVTVGTTSTVYPTDPNLATTAATACGKVTGSTTPMTFNFYPSSGVSNAAYVPAA